MFVDYVLNGQASGSVAQQMAGLNFDPGFLRPYFDERNQRCVTVNTGRTRYDQQLKKNVPVRERKTVAELMANGLFHPVHNATLLRKEDWIELDKVVVRAARLRLRAWMDLAAANTYGGFNGMSKTVLEHETMSDPGEAIVDMDGLTEGRNDAPQFQLQGLPLPITHSDFYFSSRKLATSRNSGMPLDVAQAEASGRRVAESIEKVLIGTDTGMTFGTASGGTAGIPYGRTPSVYGYTNFPSRVVITGLNNPSGGTWSPDLTLTDVLSIRNQLYGNRFYGPFMLYHSTDWDVYLDADYYKTTTSGAVAPTKTLRERLKAIDMIQDVRRLDFLTSSTNPYNFIMVQMTSDVARAVNGMDITTVQWESQGGMRINFKVMAIQVPQLRADFNGRCGIAHATL